MSGNNEPNPLDDIKFTPDLIRGVKKSQDTSVSNDYPGHSQQVETDEESEQINEFSQFKTTDYQELSQEISFLREKLERFSQDVESNYSQLQEKVAQLSSHLFDLQQESLNGNIDLESLFGRVKSLENSLESLPGQIEGRINSTLDSQQEVNKIFQQSVGDTKQEIEEIVQMLVDVESQQVDAHKLSQEISFVKEKLEEFSHVESNSLELEEKVAELSSQILELQEERSNIGAGLEPLFRRVKSLENSLQNLPAQIEEKINNKVDLQRKLNENFNQFVEKTKQQMQEIVQSLVEVESKQHMQEIVQSLVEVESEQTNSQELSQEISLLREKLGRFSDVESNYSQLQEKVAQLSSQILELQQERSNIGVGLEPLFLGVKSKVAQLSSHILDLQQERSNIGAGLEPLFRRVKSLENSLQNLPLRKYGVSVAVSCLVVFSYLFFTLGFQLGKFNSPTVAKLETPESPVSPAEKVIDINPETKTKTVSEISDTEMQEALDKFPTTSSVIQEIVKEFEDEILRNSSTEMTVETARSQIINAIKNSLGSSLGNNLDLQYGIAIEAQYDDEEKSISAKKQWIEAIYSYQKKFSTQGFGYIESGKQTADKLKCDVADLLEIKLQPRPKSCG